MYTLTNEAQKVNTQEQCKKVWTFINQIGLILLALCIHFPIFISQGIHRIHFLFSSITQHLDFIVVYWLRTTIDDLHHDLCILLQEILYPIIFIIVVALALRDITQEVGVKFINGFKAQCINGSGLITLIYDRLRVFFCLPPTSSS